MIDNKVKRNRRIYDGLPLGTILECSYRKWEMPQKTQTW